MSTAPDSNFDLDLHFLPAWAQQPPAANKFADFEGEPEGRFDRRRPNRDQDRPRRDRGPRRDGAGEGGRPGRRENAAGGRGPEGWRPGKGRFVERERREPVMVLPEIEVTIVPEEKGVEALARQIKLTGRAYPLFDIGHLILKKPERYNVRFSVIKKADGQVAQPLFLCSLDETLWLSEAEAADHVLNRHFATFYQAEKIPAEPPKGVFTFVAQCGMSGTVLGPPNYHDYQSKLRRLHAERFSHIPFEVYKSRVKIVRDEAVVKKWIEDQSFSTEYLCLNVPDTVKLSNRAEVEKHFRETHFPNVIQSVEFYTLGGVASRSLLSPPLQALARRAYEEQRRFPLKLVTTLSQMFASEGLQFFKVNKTLTHVAVSRPHYLDLNVTPVSEGIKKIVSYIDANPGCNRRKLVEALTPAAASTPAAVSPETATPAANPSVADQTSEAGAATTGPTATPAAATPEMAAVTSDLHWLIHQGHVIEFANGVLETAKMPAPKPPPKAPAKSAPAAATPSAAESTPVSESAAASPSETSTAVNSIPAEENQSISPDGPAEAPEATATEPEAAKPTDDSPCESVAEAPVLPTSTTPLALETPEASCVPDKAGT